MDLERHSTPIDELQQDGQLEQRNTTRPVHDQPKSYKTRITIRIMLRVLSFITCIVLVGLLGDVLRLRKEWIENDTYSGYWLSYSDGEVADLVYVRAPGRQDIFKNSNRCLHKHCLRCVGTSSI